MYKTPIILLAFLVNPAYAHEDDCGAFFIKNAVIANFPILKNRNTWEWYKKIRPEYVWMTEMGFYANGKFKNNGFGFAINIGSADLEKTALQRGTIEELVRFTGKNAFLTKESKFYYNEKIKERIQYSTIVNATIVNGDSIGIGLVDLEAIKLAKAENPTHMKLTAILPEKDESYTCYPAIEIIK